MPPHFHNNRWNQFLLAKTEKHSPTRIAHITDAEKAEFSVHVPRTEKCPNANKNFAGCQYYDLDDTREDQRLNCPLKWR